MDLKTYEKTRYQNIYRHKKNKNYVIMLSKPVKTSISRIDGKKIFEIDIALKVRDDKTHALNRKAQSYSREIIDDLWDKYIFNCKFTKRLAYNTINQKQKNYNKYIKTKIDKPVSKTTKEFWVKFIDNLDTTLKQKNQVMKELKCFFNWCIEENYIMTNPLEKVKKYKVPKTEMKYWKPDELKRFLECVDKDISSNNIVIKKKAYLIKILTLLGFSLGDRIGESRALTFGKIDFEKKLIIIKHSINYDRASNDFLANTKNYHSQRIIDVSDKLIIELKNYIKFLKIDLEYDINDDTLIFFNYSTNKPYTDTTLRKHFYYYCDKANVTKIRMYDLRHTYVATMMLENKELYQISERIGHKDFSTTVNKYGHLSNEVRKEIAKTTDKYY